jgi:hypothetical protein
MNWRKPIEVAKIAIIAGNSRPSDDQEGIAEKPIVSKQDSGEFASSKSQVPSSVD